MQLLSLANCKKWIIQLQQSWRYKLHSLWDCYKFNAKGAGYICTSQQPSFLLSSIKFNWFTKLFQYQMELNISLSKLPCEQTNW